MHKQHMRQGGSHAVSTKRDIQGFPPTRTHNPKDIKGGFSWTFHVRRKMAYYRITENAIRSIIRRPDRTEEGIAEGTVAAMQVARSKHRMEIWTMYKRSGSVTCIITAWRYPGKSPLRGPVPIPQEIAEELVRSSEREGD